MPTEIERKFLLKDATWKAVADGGELIRQGYLSLDKARTVRVRIKGAHAFLTIKGARVQLSCPEYEYPLPMADAEALLRDLCLRPLIEKRRYAIVHAGMTWEVDEFFGDNLGLVIAEVELSTEDQHIDLPPWIGADVSTEPCYTNACLVIRPFTRWTRAS